MSVSMVCVTFHRTFLQNPKGSTEFSGGEKPGLGVVLRTGFFSSQFQFKTTSILHLVQPRNKLKAKEEQTVFSKGCFSEWRVQSVVRFHTRAETPKCFKTLVFSGMLCPSEEGFPLSQAGQGIWKTPFGKHRLEPLGKVPLQIANSRKQLKLPGDASWYFSYHALLSRALLCQSTYKQTFSNIMIHRHDGSSTVSPIRLVIPEAAWNRPKPGTLKVAQKRQTSDFRAFPKVSQKWPHKWLFCVTLREAPKVTFESLLSFRGSAKHPPSSHNSQRASRGQLATKHKSSNCFNKSCGAFALSCLPRSPRHQHSSPLTIPVNTSCEAKYYGKTSLRDIDYSWFRRDLTTLVSLGKDDFFTECGPKKSHFEWQFQMRFLKWVRFLIRGLCQKRSWGLRSVSVIVPCLSSGHFHVFLTCTCNYKY